MKQILKSGPSQSPTKVRIEFDGQGGEYVIGKLTNAKVKSLRHPKGDLTDTWSEHDNLLHVHAVNICRLTPRIVVNGRAVRVDIDAIELDRKAIGKDALPPPNLTYFLGCSNEKGHFGSVEFAIDGTFALAKLSFGFYDLEEWGEADNNPFAGLTYDGVEYAVNADEASTTGSGYSFKIVTTDADGIIESYEELATDGD